MNLTAAVKALSALAQETRLDVFRLVVKSGAKGLAAGSIAESMGIPKATLSFHLKELVQAGLLTDRRAGRSIYYAPNPDEIKQLMGFLTEDCCDGNPDMCSPLVQQLPKRKK